MNHFQCETSHVCFPNLQLLWNIGLGKCSVNEVCLGQYDVQIHSFACQELPLVDIGEMFKVGDVKIEKGTRTVQL